MVASSSSTTPPADMKALLIQQLESIVANQVAIGIHETPGTK